MLHYSLVGGILFEANRVPLLAQQSQQNSPFSGTDRAVLVDIVAVVADVAAAVVAVAAAAVVLVAAAAIAIVELGY